MDLDGDGYLSMYELEYFYEEQLQRMEQLGIETLPFEDCLCQVRKLIHFSKDDDFSTLVHFIKLKPQFRCFKCFFWH